MRRVSFFCAFVAYRFYETTEESLVVRIPDRMAITACIKTRTEWVILLLLVVCKQTEPLLILPLHYLSNPKISTQSFIEMRAFGLLSIVAALNLALPVISSTLLPRKQVCANDGKTVAGT